MLRISIQDEETGLKVEKMVDKNLLNYVRDKEEYLMAVIREDIKEFLNQEVR